MGAGEPDSAGLGVVIGVALGTRNRPRRCAAVGKGDADEVGIEVAAGGCSGAVTLRGVIFGSGVEVAAAVGACVADIVADGNGVAATDVNEAGVSEP